MNNMLKFGIIGAGTMGGVHAKLADASGKGKICSVFDTDMERAKQMAELYGAEAFTDLDKMLSTDLDMAFVCVPNKYHAGIAVRALEKGLHIFCEKPLAVSLEEAKSIKAAADKAVKRVFVGYNRRFAPVYVQSRKTVEDPAFKGTNINIIQNDGDMGSFVWTVDLSTMGGFLYDTTIHFLDMAEFLMGEIREVRALGQTACYGIEDDFSIQLKFKDNKTGVISTSGHASWIFPFERVQVVGDHRSVITEELDQFKYSPGLSQVIEAYDFSKLPFEEKWGYKQMHDHMYDALQNGTPALNDLERGVRGVELVEACYISSSRGGDAVEV